MTDQITRLPRQEPNPDEHHDWDSGHEFPQKYTQCLWGKRISLQDGDAKEEK